MRRQEYLYSHERGVVVWNGGQLSAGTAFYCLYSNHLYIVQDVPPGGELVLLQLLHLQGGGLVVHLQDPDEICDGQHPHKPDKQLIFII